MITVNINKNSIRVAGHAERAKGAPPNNNIVCAAVSALTLTLIEGLKKVSGITIEARAAPGDTEISWEDQNDISKALIDTYVLGLEGIRDSYGEIKLIQTP